MTAVVSVLLVGCTGGGGGAKSPSTSSPPEPLPMSDIHPADVSEIGDGGTLRIGISSFPATFNPVHTEGADSTAPQILEPTLGSAVRVEQDGSWRVDPDYATSVEIVDTEPFTVRVELNKKAVWQGGTPITADDMISYVKAMQDDDFASAASPVFDAIDRVEPDGRFAYDVVFDEPNADWPSAVYPLLPKAFTKSADMFNRAMTTKAPSANGPFLVSKIERRTGTVTLERNPRWWGATPKLESIVWRIGDDDVLAEAHRAGELDAAPVTPENRTALVAAEIRASLGSEWTHLTLNGGIGPLGDADVRRAVALAVDVDEIVLDTSQRYGQRTVAMDSVVVMPGQVGFRDVARTRNLKQAQKLLAGAGWRRNGAEGPVVQKGKPMILTLPVQDSMPGAIARAEAIAEDLAEVGIEVKVEKVPSATFFEDVVIPLNFDLTTFAWQVQPSALGDAKRLFTPIDSPLNFTGKASKAITKAFDDAIAETDESKRDARIADVDEIARAQASILPLAVIPNVMAVDPLVVNFGPTALADLDWTIVGFARRTQG